MSLSLRFSWCIFCLLSVSLIVDAAAGENAAEQLSSTRTAIKESKKRQKQIEEEKIQLERELKSLQQEMVELAKKTSAGESELSEYEDKLAILKEQKITRNNSLNARHAELSTMISAMIGIKNLPPEAVIAMPGKLEQTMEAARALSILTRVIETEAESLKLQLNELDELESKIRQNQEAVISRKTELQEKQEKLAAKIKERGKLQNELGLKDKKEKDQLATLTVKSNTLQELLDTLNRKQQKAREEKTDIGKNAASSDEYTDNSKDFQAFGGDKKLQMPASGKVIQRYGSGEEAEFSHGITLKTRENASVVAPFAGEVVYAGNFRDYGKMVIIRHGNDYHTLLSGMQSINCTPGQRLVKGEPIGTMGRESDSTKLYMELRKNSKPIDPLPYLHNG